MSIIELIDWQEALTSIFSSLVVTFITAVVGVLFAKRYFLQLNFSGKMKELGFLNTSTNKQSKIEIVKMCKEASEIKIINVSGFHYLNTNENYLKNALKNGVKIKFLCADPNSVFLRNIENMEYNQIEADGKRMREKDNKISKEIFDLIEKYKNFGLEIRFYSTEYRLPYILAYYKDGSIKSWLTMTLPPYKSTKSFVLRGAKEKDQIYDSETNFIDMMETNFNTIWEFGSKSLEEILERNNGKQKTV